MDATFIISAFSENQYPPPDMEEVAFAGRSNVGKSSLINVLVNRKGLARTSSTPGRTQSINFFSVGESLYIVDLPGYGFARVPINVKKSWHNMVETYLRTRSNLKAVVVILDIRRDPTSGDIDLLNWLKYYGLPAIPVLTKADKLSRQKAKMRADMIGSKLVEIFPVSPILFSAKTKEGRKEIWEIIKQVTGCELKM
ncbi:MAG: YihA family ribosome biogenesis GTP-binding protein [Deltaproteobacteria bacterium]|nr:YihA family ribosome biogenesis GTP-binding protein [Deltaproteobacteria bacterium]MBW1909569.1 YihA family ribosome biogenesis GTP-binding protein [Deltaproteobacteria bacterium]MBW2033059.1 YihA family ribosome biogenesis GTP-binding protein [Deltaproteobacteria bacterium]MBW2114346.1 YihA family ribosome biogenesis GTP-binding protein [Deltaproteobacteria bacterium]